MMTGTICEMVWGGFMWDVGEVMRYVATSKATPTNFV